MNLTKKDVRAQLEIAGLVPLSDGEAVDTNGGFGPIAAIGIAVVSGIATDVARRGFDHLFGDGKANKGRWCRWVRRRCDGGGKGSGGAW